MGTHVITLNLHHQTVHLLPQNAVFWEEKKTLILSDLHLGKAATFQSWGVPVPDGSMEEDLIQLGHLLETWHVKHCIIVGDLIHAKAGLSERVTEQFGRWIQQQPCQWSLVIGNHDQALLKGMPASWNLSVYKEHLNVDPFCFSHFPKSHPPYFVWCGHLHPQVCLQGGHDQISLKCFHLQKDLCVLPAFSCFVGGTYVKRKAGSRIFPTTGVEVFEWMTPKYPLF